MKVCPACANDVILAARKCQHCGTEFGDPCTNKKCRTETEIQTKREGVHALEVFGVIGIVIAIFMAVFMTLLGGLLIGAVSIVFMAIRTNQQFEVCPNCGKRKKL